jgi:hypothetical protein
MNEAITAALLALIAGTTMVQIAPIKVNPWSWLGRAIGRAINAEVIQKVDKLEGDLRNLKDRSEEHEAKSCRIRILRFGDEILHGVHHSKEHFDQILLDITEYENYCRDHPRFKNNMTVITTSVIMSTYQECWKENKFEEPHEKAGE